MSTVRIKHMALSLALLTSPAMAQELRLFEPDEGAQPDTSMLPEQAFSQGSGQPAAIRPNIAEQSAPVDLRRDAYRLPRLRSHGRAAFGSFRQGLLRHWRLPFIPSRARYPNRLPRAIGVVS